MKYLNRLKLKHLLWALVIVSVAGYFISQSHQIEPSKYDFVMAKKSDIVQQVSVTGQVKSTREVDLAFEKSGKIVGVYARVGQQVQRGQTLVELKSDTLNAELLRAQAILTREQAKLEEVKAGAREEEIDFQKTKVQKSQQDIKDAEISLLDKIREAYTTADYAVRDKADQLFQNAQTANPQIIFRSSSAQMRIDLNYERFIIERMLQDWNLKISKIKNGDTYLVATITEAKENSMQVKNFLNQLVSAVTKLPASTSVPQTTIDTWKKDLATARTNIDTALANLTAAQEKRNQARSGWEVEKDQLKVVRAQTRPETIAVYQAEIKSAEAEIARIQAELRKNVLRAPFAGIITDQEAKPGAIVFLEETVMSMMEENYEIEANVPEVDVAKVKVGSAVKIAFDALEDLLFTGEVTSIDPAEKIVQGVVYYPIKVNFETDPTSSFRVMPGMTADLEVVTGEKSDVLVVPQRAVNSRDGQRFVRLLTIDETGEETTEEVVVATGLRGSEGEVEIISGIKEEDKVVTAEK